MFIRKRTKKLKNGKESVRYQAVESYRKNGKVKQRVVALGEYDNPSEALKQELLCLKRAKKDLSVPISKYKEACWRRGVGLVVLAVPIKKAKKKRAEILKRYKRHSSRISKLDGVCIK